MKNGRALNTSKPKIKTRKFGGHIYKIFDWCKDLDETRSEIQDLRNEGKQVRYSKNINGYSVWMR